MQTNWLTHPEGFFFLPFFSFCTLLQSSDLFVSFFGIHKNAEKQLFAVAFVQAFKEPLLRKRLTGVAYRVTSS